MKEIKDKRMEFVLRYYQAGKFDTQKAIRKVMPPKTVPLWRKWAVAASLGAVIFGGAYAAFTAFGHAGDNQEMQLQPQERQTPSARPAHHFHFDNTPLPEVLQELGTYYGVTLTADKTDKRLTADFDSGSLDETIQMIEQVLDVKICCILRARV